ncbi:MAG: tetratricopeptide repeat protein [Sphingomonas sp.]
MKMVSTLALAAVLTLGVASPAMAQKPPKPGTAPAAPKFELSAAFRKAGAAVETALNAGDWPGAETALVAAEGVAKNDDERYYTAFWRMRVEVHKQNRPGIIMAADALIANPKTPPEHIAEYQYKRGQATFYLDKDKRADALPFLLKARELGSTELDLPFMLAQIYGDAGKVNEAVAEMGKAIDLVKAAGRKPDQNWYEWAFAKVYKAGDRPASTVWMMRIVTDFPTMANWRRVIVLYRDSVDAAKVELSKKERLELYRMMRGTGALVDQGDYFNYAQFTLEGGLPWETIAVINEGIASGKIPKGDADFAKMLTAAQTAAKNEGSLEALAAAAKTSKESTAIGDAFMASGNPTRALALYDQALTQPGADVNVITLHRGVALVALGRKDEARAEFAKVTGTPLGDIAKLWLAWMDLPPLT